MQCNIDQRGRRVRRNIGIALILTAIGLLTWEVFASAASAGWWLYGAAIVAGAAGAFMLYEARKGWCAARAVGIRTPI
jgi:hypothetical protein